MLRNVALLLTGAVLAAAVIFACGDDGVDPADAQDATSCDCPAAEPPLAGRIMIVDVSTSGSGATIGIGATCPAGSQLLGGGCEISQETQNADSMRLFQAGRSYDGAGYGCEWRNFDAIEAEVRAWATCLTLAPAE